MKKLLLIFISTLIAAVAYSGNPDRQGEAGAAELNLFPWAKSAGINLLNTSFVSGVDAMRLNVAGLGGFEGRTQILLGHAQYLEGSEVNFTAGGIVQKLGENSALGLTIMSLDFGDINITTENQPGGTGAVYSPNFINVGLGYAHTFENKVSVGFVVRLLTETVLDVSASGIALDAGVQYVSGKRDNFKLGISMRNIGAPIKFDGEGLTQNLSPPADKTNFLLPFSPEPQEFDLPLTLNLGVSYDLYPGDNNDHKLTPVANFTSYAFSQDQIGAGLEYVYRGMFAVRGAYKLDLNQESSDGREIENVYSGVSGGASVMLPLKKGSDNVLSIDYAYRTTHVFNGTHNFNIGLIF